LTFALLRTTMSHQEAARLSFELASNITTEEDPEIGVTLDNFAGLATIFDEFASAAGAMVEAHSQKRRRVEPLTVAK
jgi:golgi-specific brefeldin A-resistance guanine nucleotide exchange factor 1